ncbi:GNAT family N-acetyltransferase [Aquimarina addita]|uniref:GNAT family N-acetyltransferase n=1 Tax=Aquimarina addita TaxID=870485 RepID=A0ABP6UM74_9FLAO
MGIKISDTKDIKIEDIIALYKANQWSAAKKPQWLYKGLLNSHTLISAWDKERLVGIGNAISDGFLVVYYPHLLVHPDYQGKGIGQLIAGEMQKIYSDFHMQMLTADGNAIDFYKKNGFEIAGDTIPMWIYNGDEH